MTDPSVAQEFNGYADGDVDVRGRWKGLGILVGIFVGCGVCGDGVGIFGGAVSVVVVGRFLFAGVVDGVTLLDGGVMGFPFDFGVWREG